MNQPGWLHPVAIEHPRERDLLGGSPRAHHPGEATSLAIATHRRWTLITDDRRARLLAARLDVPVLGTLGVLLILIDAGVLTLAEGNDLLRAMIERAGYRPPITDLRDLPP